MSQRDLTLLIAHPDDEILFLWPFLERTRHIICVADDHNNPDRAWCKERGECLREVAALLRIPGKVITLGENSDFYRLPTRDQTLKQLGMRVVGELQTAGLTVATHNRWGEYGHLDHILCNHFALCSGLPLLNTNIRQEANWLPLPSCDPHVSSVEPLDMGLCNQVKAIYDARGCWTWSKPPVEECRVWA